MTRSRFDARWRVLVAVARRAPTVPLPEPAARFARLPVPRPRPPRLRLAVAACALLYLAAAPLVERAVAAPPELKLALPRPPAIPPPPVVRPPALPRPPRPAVSPRELAALVSRLALASPEGGDHDPR